MFNDHNSKKFLNVFFFINKENGINTMNGKSIDEVILSCDKDGNGIIDYNEFKAAMLIDWLKITKYEIIK